MRAVTTPEVMLSPFVFEATVPQADRAARTIRVVVDLPFVPDTMTERIGAANSRSTPGFTRRASAPPIIPPDPRPRAREAAAAVRPAQTASRVRMLIERSGVAEVMSSH